MRLLLLMVPTFFFAACNNTAEPQGMLARFQNSKWPVYETEIYLPEDGKVVRNSTMKQFFWPNELVSTTDSSAEGLWICRSIISDYEDLHQRQCESAGMKSVMKNSLDASGRIIATVFDPGGGDPVRTGQHEYNGNTETFYGYALGKRNITVLTEKRPERIKYTTWVNTDPSAPEIHVRDYQTSGEGSELYIAAAHGNMRETSRTRVFSGDRQRISLKYEVSYENPGGLLEIKINDWREYGEWLEQVYEMRATQFNLDGITDFDEASSYITSARLVRTKKISHKQPTA